ncbi:MAG TPA: Cof-type HAD-IIB family hydrolase [Mobilitalea sp.]|nr:Cof-type HAD-IIB family hydrolase [Mobilitalea sp.]
MNYKMIALDLDGTLNNDDKKITQKTRDALIAVQKQGVTVVLASGRPTSGLKRESDALELEKYNGILLSYNGGKVVDATTKEVLYEKSLPKETAVKLLKHIEDFPVTPIVDNGKHYYTKSKDEFMIEFESKLNNMGIKEVDNVADALDFNPVKVLIAAPNEYLMPASEKIMEPFQKELSFVQSTPFYLEATMKGINKASSLQAVCDKLNIKSEEVMAFGDERNDLKMIEFAGLGVAMGNACDMLKEVADEITLSNNEDGIAHTLKKYYEI